MLILARLDEQKALSARSILHRGLNKLNNARDCLLFQNGGRPGRMLVGFRGQLSANQSFEGVQIELPLLKVRDDMWRQMSGNREALRGILDPGWNRTDPEACRTVQYRLAEPRVELVDHRFFGYFSDNEENFVAFLEDVEEIRARHARPVNVGL